jgi:hypothetical protein
MRDHSRMGQLFTRQGISLKLVPISLWGLDHIFISLSYEMAGVWPLRIPDTETAAYGSSSP